MIKDFPAPVAGIVGQNLASGVLEQLTSAHCNHRGGRHLILKAAGELFRNHHGIGARDYSSLNLAEPDVLTHFTAKFQLLDIRAEGLDHTQSLLQSVFWHILDSAAKLCAL